MFSIIDKSNYLKGLLILARKDNKLYDSEKEIIRDIAKKLDFNKDFYEEILRNLLANQYIKDEPMKFSDRSVAESFLKDGFKLACSDNDFDEKELRWLKDIAMVNNISDEEFNSLYSQFNKLKTENPV